MCRLLNSMGGKCFYTARTHQGLRKLVKADFVCICFVTKHHYTALPWFSFFFVLDPVVFRSVNVNARVVQFWITWVWTYIYCGRKKTNNYKFIPTGMFRGCPLIRGKQGKSPDEWATTKQACKDELVVYLSFSFHNIYMALLLCIEHCFTKVKILHFIYIYIYILKFRS